MNNNGSFNSKKPPKTAVSLKFFIIQAVPLEVRTAGELILIFLCTHTFLHHSFDVTCVTDVKLSVSYECHPTSADYCLDRRPGMLQVRDDIIRLGSYCIYTLIVGAPGAPPGGAVGGVAPVVPGAPANPPSSAPGAIPAARSSPVVISCSKPAGVIPIERRS